VCKECKTVYENKQQDTYYCETCVNDMRFFKIEEIYGAKPNEPNEHDDE